MLFLSAVCAFTAPASAADTPFNLGQSYPQAKSREAPSAPVKIAKGAPNIIWILLDDVGFGASSSFGGLIATPTFDALANAGLRYTNFHTAGVCSPTRAALLTGRNHHKVGMGLFPNAMLRAGFPGYHGRMQPKDGTIAEYLRQAGYSTYALGKWGLTPDEEATDLGSFEHWPSGMGFEHFFGFLGSADDQYKPNLVEDNAHVKPNGRHLNEQLIDKAIFYVDRQKKLNHDKPFFMYLAPGATHSPHQVDQPWIDKNKGKFDEGWDVYRERVFARQKKLGIIPANAKLPARDARVPAWNGLNADQKQVYTRFMEAYAGFLEYTDYEIGRLMAHLREQGLAENTAVFVIIGDNGASKEGGPNGSLTREFMLRTTDDKTQLQQYKKDIAKIGTGETFTNYPIGWSQATNTPFRQWKADANSEGATRNPLIVYWPKHLEKGVRNQYGHVIDLLPTTLEIAGTPTPSEVRGIKQEPVQGISMTYSFDQAAAPERHRQQFYYLFGSGAIVRDGWKASFNYRPDYADMYSVYPPPSESAPIPNNSGKEVWELYNLNADFNELRNLAGGKPKKLRELQEIFKKEVEANNVAPLINWSDIFQKRRQ